MSLYSTLTSLSQTAGSNVADGASDAPSTIDQQTNLLASFIAQLRDGTHEYVAAVAGTNTITGTIASSPTSYVVGRTYRFVAAGANTGAVTLNFNSIGAKSLLKVGNVALTGGELVGTCVYAVVWDGVNFQLVGMYGFKNSLATAGYQYLPTGLLIQWGSAVATTTSGATNTTALPTPFPRAQFRTFAVCGEGTGGTIVNMVEAGQSSLTTFQWVVNATGLSRINFFSLGY